MAITNIRVSEDGQVYLGAEEFARMLRELVPNGRKYRTRENEIQRRLCNAIAKDVDGAITLAKQTARARGHKV